MKYETIRRYCAKMPPLQHYPKKNEGVPFRWEDSEVIQWALCHTRIVARIFELMCESGAIVYDNTSATWRGYQVAETSSKYLKKSNSEPVLKKVKTPCSKLFNFEHRAELKTPLPISPIWGRGVIYEHQQSPSPFEIKNRGFEHRAKLQTEVSNE